MQIQSHYYSTLSINVSASELWETQYILLLQLYVSYGMVVKTVLVHPLIHRIHLLSKHFDGWGVGVWLCLVVL